MTGLIAMRNIFFSILMLNSIYAQITGVQFAPDRTHWSEEAYYRISFNSLLSAHYNIYIKGDTIINNKYCQKIYTSTLQNFDTTCMQFFGYMYYHNRRLYTDMSSAIDTTSTLQYDFNLQPADSFSFYISDTICTVHNNYYKIPVDYCDSMFYGGKWRKRIVFEPASFNLGPNPVTWVEGIGDIHHGLSSCLFCTSQCASYGMYGGIKNFYGAIEHCFCTSGWQQLNCFQEQGYSTYGLNCTSSNCATNNAEVNDRAFFSVYPNPAIDLLYVECDASDRTEVKLFDFSGRQIDFEKKTIGSKMEIDVSKLEEGVYFLQIRTDKAMGSKKVIYKLKRD